jgi:hypothetical protein|nr:MAG TPA: virion structural protein [Caudoviricetes sp.]
MSHEKYDNILRNKQTLMGEQAMLTNGQAYAMGSTRQMIDLTAAGQNGLSLDLRTMAANAAYVSRQTWCLLLEAPRAFGFLPNTDMWVTSLKVLVETACETFDGLNKSVKVEWAQTNLGATEQQEEMARVTRERSEVTMKWTERKGMPINRFFEGWITLCLGTPETQIPGLVQFRSFQENPMAISYTPDFNGATMLFFEPDEYFRTINKAWLITDMKPDNAGDVTGRKDLTAAGEKLEISVKFTGVQQVGEGVDYFAQQVLNSAGRYGLNPSSRRAFIGDDYQGAMDTYVKAAKATARPEARNGDDLNKAGFFEQIAVLAKDENVDALKKGGSAFPSGLPSGN